MGEGRPHEDDLIARFFAPLATAPGALGLKDDAATVPVPEGKELVVKTDAIVAGVHFFPEDPPDVIARKALRVNISDLVAKGAVPAGYLLTLALPPDWTADFVETFAEGLAADQEEYAVSLLGGDTVATPGPLLVSITAFGLAPEGQVPRRTGAQPGHRLYVTGTIGDAALGLALRRDTPRSRTWGLDRASREHLLDRYMLPEPKLATAGLVATYATAAMDISDGLAIDLSRLCAASGVSAVLEATHVPLSPAAARVVRADEGALATVLSGGDDYEVLLAVSPQDVEGFEEAAAEVGIRVTAVGHVAVRGHRPMRILRGGAEMLLERMGFRHF